ncbi:hypothetical protein PIROE2DRAFT_6106 [Piromyces sp. E2]|nr:hypothetical protein PIROE2DRAFT_6106 [Piromyces sp. E2]|eukprot:OUM66584.1 hypothetical protein PIROE2DRAFT_6106 [Piromyces sp. E2]
MIEILDLLSIVIPYILSVPLSLYIGGVFEKIKNYNYYKKSVILKKKNDDYDISKEQNEQDTTTINNKSDSLSSKGDGDPMVDDDNYKIKNTSLKDSIPKKVVPEISDLYTFKFWIPSTLSIKNSIIGFIIAILFGQPWLDNPIIQQKLSEKPSEESSYHQSSEHQKKSYQPLSKKEDSKIKNMNSRSSDPLNGYLTWNPEQHFNNKMKAFLVDISRLLCSCFIIPVIEELMFRNIFYRFIIGGFNYKLVSFSTWKWTAAILSNITLTHFFYIRCYGKGEEWIAGLINGYLCTYSMVRQDINIGINTKKQRENKS